MRNVGFILWLTFAALPGCGGHDHGDAEMVLLDDSSDEVLLVWLRVACGEAAPIDVLAIESTRWTPTAEQWEHLAAGGSACTATVTSAFVDRGIIQEGGPFQPTARPTFTIAE
jgi:hypothetical protein